MPKEIEIEKTYLAKFLPEGLEGCKSKEIIDFYIPKESAHAKLRIRKNGNVYTITKKGVINENDSSTQLEENIELTELEYKSLSNIVGNKIHKTRYYYPHNNQIAEIDIFQGELEGLVLIDFEFKNHKDLEMFVMPDFCLADVTEEENIAGGVLCHHTISSLEKIFKDLSYKKLKL